MRCLQIGAPKCGNFWLYQILQKVFQRKGIPAESFIEKHPIFPIAKTWDLNFPDQARIDVIDITDHVIRYRISSIFTMPIEDLQEYVSKTTHVWTHSPWCKRSGEVFHLFYWKVYILRDPRDMLVSAANYFTSAYMRKYFPQPETDPKKYLEINLDRLLEEWVWHVFDHIRMSEKYNIHIAYFEEFKHNFKTELDLLLNYLNIDLDPDQIFDLEKEMEFKTLKRKNPKHLNKGQTGYWKSYLTEEQQIQATEITRPLLDFLGYSTNGTSTRSFRRNFNTDFDLLKMELGKSVYPVNAEKK